MTIALPMASLEDNATPIRPRAKLSLTRKQKAAIVVRLLISDGADLKLSELPEDLQAQLTLQMGAMTHIDHDTLAAVAGEFAEELEAVGLSFSGGVAGALSLLDGKISSKTAAKLRKDAGVTRGNPWERIIGLGNDRLLPVLQDESIEIAAVVLSKLKVNKAAELLGMLPGERARRITYAVSMTSAVTPDAVERIGHSLADQLDAQPERAFDDDPVERVGAILNYSQSATRDDVLKGLDETDAGFAEMVRKAIFTFGNIPERIDPRDIPKITKNVEASVLITALGGAADLGYQTSADFILDNMSKRMADQIRDEIAALDTIKPDDAEVAMTKVIAEIREMEQNGDLLLLAD
ncbi:flagellar motor switch protein FliG [Parasulfitobacter algicola]|uniref:Flagellar motor switch protein FliG n=1 Tax=Parasulfitobacter algicola TaxID=2614809 RepID=A0ABX2IWV7_9RHOB|nr:FliG C-terminal domain-containing protein [Sulfitobacter algicola]NSX55462.1 flagellar motor switch protein FliG [Sulfitobacter algicola]